MITVADPSAARALLTGLAASAGFGALTVETRAALLETASAVSVVDAVCRSVELMFARRAELDGFLLQAGAGLAAFATVNAWHGLAEGGRGAGIMAALRREAGEPHPTGGAWPDPADDPAPLAEFLNNGGLRP